MKYPLTTGLAWTGGLCWKHFGQYFENSVVEDHYTGIVASKNIFCTFSFGHCVVCSSIYGF
jgi:hypothetical protein